MIVFEAFSIIARKEKWFLLKGVAFFSIKLHCKINPLLRSCLLHLDLKCWSCNNNNQFCDDPFDSSKLNAAEKLSLYDCPNGRCVKTIANIPGESPKHSYSRSHLVEMCN